MRIVFMGTPDFAVPSLERLVEAGYVPVAVVTGPDRPRGRGQEVTPTPVKMAAQRLGISTILQPESVRSPDFAEEIRQLRPDVIVVVAFRILPPEVFQAASRGAFNLHGSLLPKYRGAAPINHAIMNGESETGVTTFFLRPEVDTGNIILQKTMPIGPDDTAGDVHDRMMHLGAEAVVETVRLIESGEARAAPQDDSEATPAPKIFRDDCRIDWGRPATAVHNQIRGLSPYPGAWTTYKGRLIKIYRTRVHTDPSEPEAASRSRQDVHTAAKEPAPGEILEAGDRLLVAAKDGVLEILELQQEGKRRLPAKDFLLGMPVEVGGVLGDAPA